MKRIAMTIASMAMALGAVIATTTPAQAQVEQDGLVNVNIGDVNVLNDARIAVAANVVANACGVSVGPVAVLGEAVDRSGDAVTVCQAATGPVTITQN